MASKKLHLDKYYTPQSLADYCTQKAIEVIGIENITELVESSAGNGVFLNSFEKLLPNIPYQAYDIEPEDDRIVKQDYLKLEMGYKKGRVVLGNPPFGDRANILFRKFYDKGVEQGDYIGFILPLSQYNNTRYLYKFNLIHTEKLKLNEFSGVELSCVFNIYKRPLEGLNKQKTSKLKAITIFREDSNKFKKCEDYDIRMCYMGSAGKILNENESYSAEYKIKINDIRNKDRIIELLSIANWKEYVNWMTKPKIQQFHIIEYLKEQIPELE